MSTSTWLHEHFGVEKFHGDFDRFKSIFNKHKFLTKAKVITVAGTNGKGQTARLVNHYAMEKDKKTALWSSPHLISVEERFQFGKGIISEDELLRTFQTTKLRLGDDWKKISYFEFLFLCFINLAESKKVDLIILEAGLGGRLDASNVIDADLVILTSISRDHQKTLGNSFKKILLEKCGLARKGRYLVSCLELDYLNQEIEKRQREIKFKWEKIEYQHGHNFCDINLKLALKGLNLLGDVDENSPYSVADPSLYAQKFHYSSDNCNFSFYPSHNPDGFRKLFQFLQIKNYNKLIISFSNRPIEDMECMVKTGRYYFRDEIVICRFSGHNSCPNDVLKKLGEDFDITVYHSYQELDSHIKESKSSCLVTGSNYFIADYFQWLQGNSRREITV